MPLPDLTNLQFAVLVALGGVERSGKEIRSRLVEQGVSKTLAAFYQLMARMEDAKLVEGSYRKGEVAGQPVQERWYKITGAGISAYNEAQRFYSGAPSFALRGEVRYA